MYSSASFSVNGSIESEPLIVMRATSTGLKLQPKAIMINRIDIENDFIFQTTSFSKMNRFIRRGYEMHQSEFENLTMNGMMTNHHFHLYHRQKDISHIYV